MRTRTTNAAFHPNADQIVLPVSDSVFSVMRKSQRAESMVLTVVNVTPFVQTVTFSGDALGFGSVLCRDLLSDKEIAIVSGNLKCELQPYQVMWLGPTRRAIR